MSLSSKTFCLFKSFSFLIQSEQSKKNYYQRIDRLDRIKTEKELNRQKVLEDREMNDYIRYALDTESKKNEKNLLSIKNLKKN